MDPAKKYGLLGGLTFSVWQYFEYYSGLHATGVAEYSGFVPVPVFVLLLFFAIREKRKQMGGYMEFAEGMKTGLGASAIAGVIYSIAFYIYCKWVNTEWVNKMAAQFRKNLMALKPVPNDVDKQVQDFIANYAFRSSIMVMVSLLFLGGIASVIMAAIMRKKPPTTDVSSL